MEATLDITKNGDYIIPLTREEITSFLETQKIKGTLSFIKTGSTTHGIKLFIYVLPDKLMRAIQLLKNKTSKHHKYKYGPNVLVHQTERNHIIYYKQGVNFYRLLEKERYIIDHRYDSVLMRKVIIYRDKM